MILVDTSVWINYFNGIPSWQTDLLDRHLSEDPVFIGDLILTEVLQGFRSDRDFHTAKQLLSGLRFCRIGGYDLAVQSARNYRFLRKSGVTVRKTIDVLIGTFCIMEGMTLLHDDRDFNPMAVYLSLKTPQPF